MIRKMLTILALMLTMTQGAWGTTVYVSTYAELKAAIENVNTWGQERCVQAKDV